MDSDPIEMKISNDYEYPSNMYKSVEELNGLKASEFNGPVNELKPEKDDQKLTININIMQNEKNKSIENTKEKDANE